MDSKIFLKRVQHFFELWQLSFLTSSVKISKGTEMTKQMKEEPKFRIEHEELKPPSLKYSFIALSLQAFKLRKYPIIFSEGKKSTYEN